LLLNTQKASSSSQIKSSDSSLLQLADVGVLLFRLTAQLFL
jgi:hypothetical protein